MFAGGIVVSGRANSKINVEFHGSGKVTEPSAITMPGRNGGEAPAVRVPYAHHAFSDTRGSWRSSRARGIWTRFH